MLTTDIALIKDPIYLEISKRFYENPDELNDAFARAWYRLTRRDMGPRVRLLGPEVAEPQLWQDPVPAVEAAEKQADFDVQVPFTPGRTDATAEMTVLVGGMRTLGANLGGSKHGVFTTQTGMLNNEWFVNLLSMDTKWSKSDKGEYLHEGRDRQSGELKYTATSVDLVFGSNSQLRALAEVYARSDAKQKLVEDFVAAWNKVMMLDRFELSAIARGDAS